MTTDRLGITILETNTCWDLLRSADVGRLAVAISNHPDIFPINYVVDHGTIVFRTAEGTKLAAAVLGRAVAFEIDGYDAEAGDAWSVVVKGQAVEIERMQDVFEALSLPLFPWHAVAEAPLRAHRARRRERAPLPRRRPRSLGCRGIGADQPRVSAARCCGEEPFGDRRQTAQGPSSRVYRCRSFLRSVSPQVPPGHLDIGRKSVSITDPQAPTTPTVAPPVALEPVPDAIVVRRRTIDIVLVVAGFLMVVVLAIAGALLTWGSNFAEDYVEDELSSQNIFFPDAAALEEDGRQDLLEFADEQVTTGDEAEAYASFIDGHLAGIADGATYADLGGPQRAASAELAEAQESGADEDTIAELQATVDEITGQRDTLFKGETLRGLLLSTFAWSTIGRIAGIAAIAAFVAAAVMLVLVIAGLVHLFRQRPAHAAA